MEDDAIEFLGFILVGRRGQGRSRQAARQLNFFAPDGDRRAQIARALDDLEARYALESQ